MTETMDDAADSALVDQARRGDREAFAELVRGCQAKVFMTIVSFTRNTQDADDLMQDVFVQAYRRLDRFKGRSTFFTWVYRIAVNHTLNFLKRKKREAGRRELDERTVRPADNPASGGPEAEAVREELERRIREAVDLLPLIYRAAFNLVAGQGLSHGLAARALGVTENTVSWRMHRARKMLQAKLGPYLQGGDP